MVQEIALWKINGNNLYRVSPFVRHTFFKGSYPNFTSQGGQSCANFSYAFFFFFWILSISTCLFLRNKRIKKSPLPPHNCLEFEQKNVRYEGSYHLAIGTECSRQGGLHKVCSLDSPLCPMFSDGPVRIGLHMFTLSHLPGNCPLAL